MEIQLELDMKSDNKSNTVLSMDLVAFSDATCITCDFSEKNLRISFACLARCYKLMEVEHSQEDPGSL